MSNLKYKWNDNPLCPYCDYEYENGYDLELGQDEETEIECPNCDLTYSVISCWSQSFSTSKKGK